MRVLDKLRWKFKFREWLRDSWLRWCICALERIFMLQLILFDVAMFDCVTILFYVFWFVVVKA
jgi:hypothetical protein